MKEQIINYFCDNCQKKIEKPKKRYFEMNFKINNKIQKTFKIVDLCDNCLEHYLNKFNSLIIEEME